MGLTAALKMQKTKWSKLLVSGELCLFLHAGDSVLLTYISILVSKYSGIDILGQTPQTSSTAETFIKYNKHFQKVLLLILIWCQNLKMYIILLWPFPYLGIQK